MVLLFGWLLYCLCKASMYALLSITYTEHVQHVFFGRLPALCWGCSVSVHISVSTFIHSENGNRNVHMIQLLLHIYYSNQMPCKLLKWGHPLTTPKQSGKHRSCINVKAFQHTFLQVTVMVHFHKISFLIVDDTSDEVVKKKVQMSYRCTEGT